jgi:hypothetical protein
MSDEQQEPQDDLEQQNLEQPSRRKTYLERNGGVPLDHPRRCQAQRANGAGPCRRFAIKGGIVCRVHGGSAVQVQNAAQTRLKLAADRMARNLLGLAEEAKSEHVQYLATTAALDRAGVVEPKQVNVDLNAPWAEVFQAVSGIAQISQAESRAARGLPAEPPTAALSAPEPGDYLDAEVVPDAPVEPRTATDRGDVPARPVPALQPQEQAMEELRWMQKRRPRP